MFLFDCRFLTAPFIRMSQGHSRLTSLISYKQKLIYVHLEQCDQTWKEQKHSLLEHVGHIWTNREPQSYMWNVRDATCCPICVRITMSCGPLLLIQHPARVLALPYAARSHIC